MNLLLESIIENHYSYTLDLFILFIIIPVSTYTKYELLHFIWSDLVKIDFFHVSYKLNKTKKLKLAFKVRRHELHPQPLSKIV